MNVEKVLVTPAIARNYLANNEANRNYSNSKVNQYAKAMERGEWKMNGETISISVSGNLLNGQHRMRAIIQANKPIEMLIVTGLPDDVMPTIDNGKARTSADTFQIHGIPNSSNMASSCAKYLALIKNYPSGARFTNDAMLSNLDILNEYYQNQNDYNHLLSKAKTFYAKSMKTISTSEHVAYSRYFSMKYSFDIIDNFWDAYLRHDGIAGLLMDKLLNNVISKRKMLPAERHGLIMKAFVYYAKGKPLSRLTFASDEKALTI